MTADKLSGTTCLALPGIENPASSRSITLASPLSRKGNTVRDVVQCLRTRQSFFIEKIEHNAYRHPSPSLLFQARARLQELLFHMLEQSRRVLRPGYGLGTPISHVVTATIAVPSSNERNSSGLLCHVLEHRALPLTYPYDGICVIYTSGILI